jgi:hypothetical protein
MTNEAQVPDMGMDANSLFREEVYTDGKVGTIRCMTPVTADGQPDASRSVMYSGQTQLMTPAGALPLNFEIEADSLAVAVEKFAEYAAVALEETMEELKEMRRQQSSSIVVPGQPAPGSPIQMP